jgi:hypothetical protein
MPEVLTKHPDVVRGFLEQSGGKCGPGQTQAILKDCPPEQFCSVTGGEICIYGVQQAGQMTQLPAHELRERLCIERADVTTSGGGCGASCGIAADERVEGDASVIVIAAAVAALSARWWSKPVRRPPRSMV